jgi:ferredoxin
VLETRKSVCLKCGACVPLCPVEALILLNSGISCLQEECILCGDCAVFCPVQALEIADV